MKAARDDPMTAARRVALVLLVVLAALPMYGTLYAYARVTHRLVHSNSICDGERVVLGAGANRAWALLLAPLMAVETGVYGLR